MLFDKLVNLLLEQKVDQNIIIRSIKEFLPEVEIVSVDIIGSSALSPEEQRVHDIEKYGFERVSRDIDIQVSVRNVTSREIEQWALSDIAQELEDVYNYDVQLLGV